MSSISLTQIPPELRGFTQWVNWRAEPKPDGKINKIPINPNTFGYAKSTDPNTWGSFDQVVAALGNGHNLAGIGFVLTEEDPFVGIDIDSCRNPETGEIEPRAMEAIKLLNGYCEVSPSKKGVRIIVKGKLPPGARKKGSFEV